MAKIAIWIYRNGLEWLVGSILLVIVCLSSSQVFFRYVLNAPLNWIEEFARLLLVWAVMLGAAAGIKRNCHLTIDFVKGLTSGGVRAAHAVAINVLVGLVALAMVRYGLMFYLNTAGDYSTSLGFARNLFYLPIPISGALSLAFLIPNTVAQVREALRPAPGVDMEEER